MMLLLDTQPWRIWANGARSNLNYRHRSEWLVPEERRNV